MTYETYGYMDLELSTQILIKEAIKRDIGVEVIDTMSNTIRLSKDGKKELVMQATRTSKDTYIAPLIMTNKHVTKVLLKEEGINVPEGHRISSLDQGVALFNHLQSIAIVIKPLSTNFGQGITILDKGFDYKAYEEAIEFALSYDEVVLIEPYVEGKEYRILVIDDQVVGVLHRVPANVTGDGLSTIRELVEEKKNQDPLRGTAYKKPLEKKLKLGKIELDYLAEQGLDEQSVLDKDHKVFLRINSNISTGGDSIDYTDEIHKDYLDVAIKAARSVGAKICGVDMIIRDIHNYEDSTYSIIELNFNPAIHIHNFPYQGKNRLAEHAILSLLGF